MRYLNNTFARRGSRVAQRGLTLVEMAVAFCIVAFLMSVASPYFRDFLANAALRGAGQQVLVETLYAQGEAIKRDGAVRLSITGGTLSVIDRSGAGAGTVIRSLTLADTLSAGTIDVDFGSRGAPTPFGTAAAIDIEKSGIACSDEFRCPRVIIDGGGGVRLCANRLSCN
jgi:type II secretory pathway pseudopilin PulG